ncbi:MAG: DNA mismatch repair protein MutL [Parachlamydia sp.]|nr:MAG: DNA mismatch repair protein MutL [Parachlamydia sp.]
MHTKIRILDEHTINKIAAGEVIENPSSVVKELIENSIDAGASEICVEIHEGGRQLIRISDNGCGMNQDDALLSLERHATSKLQEVEDMETLTTMGFRGEAIPSIASISKFMLLTAQENTQNGTLILVEGGKVLRCGPAARSVGTTIEVKSLFFNVPVRRKFQKSPSFDTHEILKILTIQALAHPHIQFELISDHKSVLRTPPSKQSSFKEILYERMIDVLGNDFAKDVTFLEGQEGDCRIIGYIGQPMASRPSKNQQFLFINQRAVSCPAIAFAIREGYGTALAAGRYPVFMLHLTLPGSLIDVNVHPQKKEVRIRQEHLIKNLLHSAVQKALHIQEACATHIFAAQPSFMAAKEERTFTPPSSPPPMSFSFGGQFFDHSLYDELDSPKTAAEIPQKIKPMIPPPIPATLPAFPPAKELPEVKVLTTIKGFILAENGNGLYLIDQRAAHSRVLFEQLAARQSQNPLSMQRLLIPYTLEVTSLEASKIKEHLGELNAIGIQIQEFGTNTFLIDGLPSLLGNVDIELLMEDLVKALCDSAHVQPFKQEKEKQFARLANKITISAERKLSLEEAETLLKQLWTCQTPRFCALGKPTLVALTSDDLLYFFKHK